MKVIKHLFLWSSICLSMAFFTIENENEKIVGQWFAPAMENATVEIYKAEDGYSYGRILDCDKKEWIGEIVLKKLQYNETEAYWKGKVYGIKRNITANVKISVAEENQIKLACTKWFITKTYYWSKK